MCSTNSSVGAPFPDDVSEGGGGTSSDPKLPTTSHTATVQKEPQQCTSDAENIKDSKCSHRNGCVHADHSSVGLAQH